MGACFATAPWLVACRPDRGGFSHLCQGDHDEANTGCGLQNFLGRRKKDIQGILNGLDYQIWNPETDDLIPQKFSGKSLTLRKANKSALVNLLGLPDKPKTPLLGMVSRLDPQKGVDLAFDVLRSVKDQDWQFILVGTGNPELEKAARSLQADFHGSGERGTTL